MSTYSSLKNEPEILKIKTRDDEMRNLRYQTEKHGRENIKKSLKIDNKSHEKYIKICTKGRYY